jgi:hypothetical protein
MSELEGQRGSAQEHLVGVLDQLHSVESVLGHEDVHGGVRVPSGRAECKPSHAPRASSTSHDTSELSTGVR